jgi:hypothetical protein
MRLSSSTSGMWKRSTVWIMRHRQTKEPDTDRPSLNHRATSRLYKMTMTKAKRGRYTLEFKQEAARLVESGQSVAFLIMWRTSVLIIWHIWLDLGRISSGLPDD